MNKNMENRCEKYMEQKWDQMSFADQKSLQDKKIKAFMNDIYNYHPHYHKIMKDKNLKPSDFNGTDDFIKKFPFTNKMDIAPTDENPFKPTHFILQKTEDIGYMPRFMIATTGRTAFSTPFWYTNHDLENLMLKVARRVGEVTGMDDKDIIMNSFPYSPHLAFWLVYYASTGTGKTAIHSGGGKIMGTHRIVGSTFSMKASVLVGVPGYLTHLVRTAKSLEKHMNKIRLVITGGDRCPINYRRRLVDNLMEMNAPNPTICAAYGFTESRIAPVECRHPQGVDGELTGYHTYPDLEFWYTIDPKTGERLEPGEKGELVWSSLGGRGTVVMNYRTGDIAEHGIKYEKCPWCGRTVPIISSMISRTSEVKNINFQKIKGTLLDFNQFYNHIPENKMIDEWQIVMKKNESDMDELILNVSLKKDYRKLKPEKAILEISNYIKDKMEISPTAVNIMTLDAITRQLGMETQLKEKRILDLRPK
jgi:phenylacetate-CoA ligase